MRTSWNLMIALLLAASTVIGQTPLGNEFTYQGQLTDNGVIFNGTADLTFTLWDAEVGGSQVGPTLQLNALAITDGLVLAELDFGAVFDGDQRWLEITVTPDGGSANVLSPRQKLTASPFAVHAFNAEGGGGGSPWQMVGSSVYYDGGDVGVGTDNPAARLHVAGAAVSGLAANVNDQLYINDSLNFVGVGRNERVSPSEYFGINTPTGSGTFGGMYVRTADTAGWPFYGYATGSGAGTARVWHFYDGQSESWKLNAGGQVRLTVDAATGHLGLGTTPAARLHIGGSAGVDGIMFPDGTLQTTAATGGSSLWQNSGSILYYNAGRVGVGTMSPLGRLSAFSANETTSVLEREDTATSAAVTVLDLRARTTGTAQDGFGAAINFNVETDTGALVPTAGLQAIWDDSDAFFPRGDLVFRTWGGGIAERMRLTSEGRLGLGTTSPDNQLSVVATNGRTIGGYNNSTVDFTAGIFGQSAAANGYGVHGQATAASGNSVGVFGESPSAGGRGVYGKSTNASGNFAYGVYGDADGTLARGVYGRARATNGASTGVYGRSDSADDGVGVYGIHQSSSGSGAGVHAVTNSTDSDATALYAEVTPTAGGLNSTAVYGVNQATNGNGYGVRGTATTEGVGVKGLSALGAGVEAQSLLGPGIYAHSAGSATFDGYAVLAENTGNGSVIYATNDSASTNTILVNEGSGALLKAYRGSGGNDLVFEIKNDGEAVCAALEITGGADLAEHFDINVDDASADRSINIEPGMVVCIDPRNPGELRLATQAYDRTVAGVISGANGVNTGMVMGQKGSIADGSQPVALTGRVWTWCQAGDAAIEPGDLLTTSSRAGYAMRVTDRERAHGAIIGKAMTELAAGESGMVLVLVSLH